MPIYVYEATIWSENEPVNECCSFEALQAIHEEPFKKCITCGRDVHRAVTAFAISTQPSNSSLSGFPYSAFDKKKGDSPAAKAARLAMRHVCGMGCKH